MFGYIFLPFWWFIRERQSLPQLILSLNICTSQGWVKNRTRNQECNPKLPSGRQEASDLSHRLQSLNPRKAGVRIQMWHSNTPTGEHKYLTYRLNNCSWIFLQTPYTLEQTGFHSDCASFGLLNWVHLSTSPDSLSVITAVPSPTSDSMSSLRFPAPNFCPVFCHFSYSQLRFKNSKWKTPEINNS